MVEKRKRGRPTKKDQELRAMQAKERLEKNNKKDQWLIDMHARAQSKAEENLNQRREGAVNLRYVAERLRDIKNMDEVEAFYKECVYNIGINTLRNGEADG
jgi:methylthioribose-1-phosphate isomerase